MKQLPFTKMPRHFADDPAVASVSALAELLWCRSMALCDELSAPELRPGNLARLTVKMTDPEGLAAELVREGLWAATPTGWTVVDAVPDQSKASTDGKRGAHNRWHGSVPFETCPECHPIGDPNSPPNGTPNSPPNARADQSRADENKPSSSSTANPRGPVDKPAGQDPDGPRGGDPNSPPSSPYPDDGTTTAQEQQAVALADTLTALALEDPDALAGQHEREQVAHCLAIGWTPRQLTALALDVAARDDVRNPPAYWRRALEDRAGRRPEPGEGGDTAGSLAQSQKCAAADRCTLNPACWENAEADCIAAGAVT